MHMGCFLGSLVGSIMQMLSIDGGDSQADEVALGDEADGELYWPYPKCKSCPNRSPIILS